MFTRLTCFLPRGLKGKTKFAGFMFCWFGFIQGERVILFFFFFFSFQLIIIINIFFINIFFLTYAIGKGWISHPVDPLWVMPTYMTDLFSGTEVHDYSRLPGEGSSVSAERAALFRPTEMHSLFRKNEGVCISFREKPSDRKTYTTTHNKKNILL